MKVQVFKESQNLIQAAVEFIIENVPRGGVMGFATGGTPLDVYKGLATSGWNAQLSTAFALDEYLGVCEDNPASFSFYIRKNIEIPLGLEPGFVKVPNGCAEDPQLECELFESAINQSPIDLQILGVGKNGHIAFNEPGATPDSFTRVVDLALSTRHDNGEDFNGLAPARALTQGVGTILKAKKLLLIVRGASKAAALKMLFESEASPEAPVTFLRSHSDLTVLADEAAMSLVKRNVSAHPDTKVIP